MNLLFSLFVLFLVSSCSAIIGLNWNRILSSLQRDLSLAISLNDTVSIIPYKHMWTTQGVQVNYNDFRSVTKPSSLQKESRPYKIQIDLIKAHSFLIDTEKPLESRAKGKLSDIDIVRALTALNLRWNRVPSNRTLMNPPPYGKHYRLALFVTADYPESVKVNTREVTNTIISLALMQRSYDFFPIIFTISKPLIQLAQYLNIGYYYGYDHNTFHMPLVNKMFEVAMRDVSADYYGIVNSDILLSDRIFLVLDQVDAMVEEGTVSPIRALAGVVHDAASVDLLTPATEPSGFTLTAYRGLIKKMVDRQYYYRHYCSAVGSLNELNDRTTSSSLARHH